MYRYPLRPANCNRPRKNLYCKADPRKSQTPPRMKEQEKPHTHYWGETPEEEYLNLQGIQASKSFYTSPRGLKLFTRSWLPLSTSSSNPRGLICMVHGYGNDISWTFQATPIFLAQNGFACFAIDIEGHGQSQDCLSFFNFVKQETRFRGLPSFLFGESMGGAICLLIHFADPKGFDGAVLVAPMCKISETVSPKWPIPQVLSFVARFLPTLPIVPTGDLLANSVKVDEKKIIAVMNPMRYKGKPRLGTVVELLRVTDYLSKRLNEVSLPFLVVHGSADYVTDPNVSRALYEEAKSEDKTIKIYEGMMHSLLFGETDENIEVVRNDILKWLNDRCKGRAE
ncbi:hypothetical protein CIPAW_10G045400 [Carya illinoinensis]|uniref:Serine aminopeptidase S33 domain-containing protein n=2 Tax=Carya illinoinensis TaxID=32201 RepID=A0A8T1PC44_CARIL|nr:hypothetical protein CIPAW_10G045400 [Carya illinoinensis]